MIGCARVTPQDLNNEFQWDAMARERVDERRTLWTPCQVQYSIDLNLRTLLNTRRRVMFLYV